MFIPSTCPFVTVPVATALHAQLAGGTLQTFLVSTEKLDEWYWSRLVVACIVAVVVGFLAAKFHLCRIEYPERHWTIDVPAWVRFGVWLVSCLALASVLLLLDAWLLYPFGARGLDFADALSQVWINNRSVIIVAAVGAVFSLTVVLTTRLSSTCRCQYTFFPWPKARRASR